MTTPMQYASISRAAARNYISGRGKDVMTEKERLREVAKAKVIFGVVLPTLYVAMKSGLLRDSDEEDGEMVPAFDDYDLATGLITNSVLSAPLLGDIIEQGINVAYEKPFDYTITPIQDDVLGTVEGGVDLVKIMNKGDFTHHDISKATTSLIDAFETFTGLPIDNALNLGEGVKNIYDNGADLENIKSSLGYGDYAIHGEKVAGEMRKNERQRDSFASMIGTEDHELVELFDQVDPDLKVKFNVQDQKDVISDDKNEYTLDGDQHDDLNRLYKKMLKVKLEKEAKTNRFKKMSPNEKAEEIGYIKTEIAADARYKYILRNKSTFKASQIQPK